MEEGEGRGKGGCGTQVVGGDYDAVFEFYGEDGGSRYDGLLGVGVWGRGLEVGGVVGAVDIVSGLGRV